MSMAVFGCVCSMSSPVFTWIFGIALLQAQTTQCLDCRL